MGLLSLKNGDAEAQAFCANDNYLNCQEHDPENLECFNNGATFSVMHLHIRSLSKHDNDLASLLNISGCQFNHIGCSETWLHDSSFIDTLN